MLGSSTRFFLSSALSPHVQGASRWTAVNAISRQAFALSGKDEGSPLLHWLAGGRQREGTGQVAFERAAAKLQLDVELTAGGFVGWYRSINSNYPFLDYADPAARRADRDLMDAYASGEAAPPPQTPWPGPGLALPAGSVTRHSGAELQTLSAWLQIACGYTKTRPIRNLTIAHRTSPSGGARHPTELGVRLGSAWMKVLGTDVPAWWYDGLSHELRPARELPVPDVLGADEIGILVTSHAIRAMWRYRDVRAFRPVVIDAGHVIETLMTVVDWSGWRASWCAAAGMVQVDGKLDPSFGYVYIQPPSQPAEPPALPSPAMPTDTDDQGKRLRSNPLLSLSATRKGLFGEVPGRGTTPVRLTPGMVDALAYATPSSRGDRPTDPHVILSRFGLEPAQLAQLTSNGLMLSESAGDRLWVGARDWFEHGWLPSLVVHAFGAMSGQSLAWEPFEPTWVTDLPQALDNRRTCRDFSGEPLPEEPVEQLLKAAMSASSRVRLIAFMTHKSQLLAAGTHVWDGERWRQIAETTPSESELKEAAIGQPWAIGFASSFLIVPSDERDEWESNLVEAGRIAQRMALAVLHDPRVGLFQSPALVDSVLSSIAPHFAMPEGAYLVGVGMAADQARHDELRFKPSGVFLAGRD